MSETYEEAAQTSEKLEIPVKEPAQEKQEAPVTAKAAEAPEESSGLGASHSALCHQR